MIRSDLLKTIVLTVLTFSLLCTCTGTEGPAAPATQHHTTAQRHLHILSWNIYMLPPLIMFTGKQKRAEVIGDILSSSDYDLIVFQEAFHPKARHILSQKLKDRFPYQVGPVNPSRGIKTSSGVWFVSRYPIQLIGVTEFSDKAGIDNKMARKGAGMVKLTMGDKTFHIIGTHLNAGGEIAVRHSQVKQIRTKLVDKYAKNSIPLILCGDMNIDCYHPEGYDGMMEILDAEDCIPGGMPRCYTNDPAINDLTGPGNGEVIDYFFYRLPDGYAAECDVPYIKQQWSKKHKSLSDHEPVSLKLTW
jgi:sphingomyelin phosphodiesterase